MKYSDNLLNDLIKAKFKKELCNAKTHKTYDMTRACICADKVKVTKAGTKIIGGPRQTVELKRISATSKPPTRNGPTLAE